MANLRLKICVLAMVAFVLFGLFGSLFLAGYLLPTPSERASAGALSTRSLLQAHDAGARVRSVVVTVTIKDAQEDDYGSGSSDSITVSGPPRNVSNSTSSDAGDANEDSDEALRGLRVSSVDPMRGNGSLPRATKRVLGEAISACDVRQPYTANCYKLFAEGQERTVQRLAEAVGHLEIDEDGVACSGVLLDGKSKTSMYFLTAARCLPNEKHLARARIHFTGCAGTTTYTKPAIYAISRFLGYMILRLNVDATAVRSSYGFLHLRASRRQFGEKVFIAHYAHGAALKRLTTTMSADAITLKPFEPLGDCVPASPQSCIGYSAPLMDAVAFGAPVISLVDGAVVALHMCGDCHLSSNNVGVVSHSILVDLDNQALEVGGFSQRAQDE